MAYLILWTFDLKQGSTSDYQTAYADLASIAWHVFTSPIKAKTW